MTKYNYTVSSDAPLKVVANGGAPIIVVDLGETPDISVGDTDSRTAADGWGFDLSITRNKDTE